MEFFGMSTQPDVNPQPPTPVPPKVAIHIEVNKTHFTEHHSTRTGLQIKEDANANGAGIKLTDTLEVHEDGRWDRVNDADVVTLKEGMRFRTHPGGSDS
jgi:hypothetical protein